MNINSTPLAQRIHIGFFGKRNAGKSSIVNAITNQEVSIVSDKKGTTTDPVKKTMEILPLGPVVITDTPGYDDEGELGELRVKRTKEVLKNTDIAILVIDSKLGLDREDEELINIFKQLNIKYIIVYNKCDLIENLHKTSNNEIYTSVKNNTGITELKNLIASLKEINENPKPLVQDLISNNDIIILVTPIDSSAPKGRLILPQQQVIRDLLDKNGIVIVIQETEIKQTLNTLNKKPKLVITDSQVFNKIKNEIPKDIFLTSFSILFARYKGILNYTLDGVKKIKLLQDNDLILISEGCTHHRQCNDIGTVKLPKWIQNYTGKKLNFEFSSGNDFPENISKYKMIIHCGGCMLKESEVINRYKLAQANNIPIVNYGIIISEMNNILDRSIEIFSGNL